MSEWSEAESHARRAMRLFEVGRLEEALAELRAALDSGTPNAEWLVGMGRVLEAMGRLAEAVDCWRRADALEPDEFETHYLLAGALTRLERHREGAAEAAKLIELDPAFEPAYCLRILNLAECGLHDEAEVTFYLARQITDRCPRCSYHIGRSLAARGQSAKAVASWQEALRLDPRLEGVNRRLALAYWAAGDLQSARRHFAAELRLLPRHGEALVEFGRLLLQMDDRGGAGRMFERAFELDPGNAAAARCLAETRLRGGHVDEALAVCRNGLHASPGDAGLLAMRAEVWLELGRADRARRDIEAASAAEPDLAALPGLHERLKGQERRSGWLRAVTAWGRSLARWWRRRRG